MAGAQNTLQSSFLFDSHVMLTFLMLGWLTLIVEKCKRNLASRWWPRLWWSPSYSHLDSFWNCRFVLQHQPDMVQWISLKSIFLVLCTQTLTRQQQRGCTSVFNQMQKGFKDMRQNPTHDPSHCALIPIPRDVVVEGFLVNALQCRKVHAIYSFTNSDLRNVIYS